MDTFGQWLYKFVETSDCISLMCCKKNTTVVKKSGYLIHRRLSAFSSDPELPLTGCFVLSNLQFLKTLKPECLTAMLGSKPVRTHFIFILTLKWILTETVSVWFHALCCCSIIHVTVHVLLIQWLWLCNTYYVEIIILKLVWLLFTGKLLPLALPPSQRNSAGLKSAVISIYRALPGRTALAVKCIFASPWTSSLYLCMLQIIYLSSTFILLKQKKRKGWNYSITEY